MLIFDPLPCPVTLTFTMNPPDTFDTSVPNKLILKDDYLEEPNTYEVTIEGLG